MKERIVIDTNVIISSLIQSSYPYLIVFHFVIDDKVEFCLSDQLIEEYYDVLRRPKFARYPDFLSRAESLLIDLESKASFFNPSIQLDILDDKDDNMLLELADCCKADYIITGITNDFRIKSFHQTKILTPKEFWDIALSKYDIA
jgi:putative PIN family toxin of toxin-antitoxin system